MAVSTTNTQSNIVLAMPFSISHNFAISDTGKRATLVVTQALVLDICPTTIPITMSGPDGNMIHLIHTCTLDLVTLPSTVREANMITGLKHTSLISAEKLIDAGCDVTFDDNACIVKCDNVSGWKGHH